MHYRSPALTSAQLSARQVSRHPKLSVIITGPEGPERLDIATTCFGAERYDFISGRRYASNLAQVTLDALRRDLQRPQGLDRGVLIDAAEGLQPGHQHALYRLTYHTRIVLMATSRTPLLASINDRLGTQLHIPPLKERREDIAPLVLSGLAGAPPHYAIKTVSQEVWDVLLAKDWLSSRELCRATQEAAIAAHLQGADEVCLIHLPPDVLAASPHGFLDIPLAKGWTKRKLEDAYLLHAYTRLRNQTVAAEIMGLSRQGYIKRLAQLTGKGQDPGQSFNQDHADEPELQVPRAPQVTHYPERWARCGATERVDKGCSYPPGPPPRHLFEERAELRHQLIANRKGTEDLRAWASRLAEESVAAAEGSPIKTLNPPAPACQPTAINENSQEENE